MYTLDQLLKDVLGKSGPLLAKRGSKEDRGEWLKVWDAVNRYLTAVLDKRQTLSIPNLCKIGWRLDQETGGRARMRPHFQLHENFARAYGLSAQGHPSVAEKSLTTIEEFNYSKAAIRYSQSLTKDHMFMGLRAILQRIGEVMGSGEAVSIDFEVGKIVAQDRDVRFCFVADLYTQEGLEVPQNALAAANYKPSVTFAPPSKDALTLSLQGSNNFAGPGNTSARDDCSNAAEMQPTMRSPEDEDASTAYGSSYADSEESDATRPPARALGLAGTPRIVEHGHGGPPGMQVSPEEHVHNQALGRHVEQIEGEAEVAVAEKGMWEDHLSRCVVEEQKDADWRRRINLDHGEQLKAQMKQAEDRRASGRMHAIEQASLHDFPNFTDTRPDIAEDQFKEYIRDRRNRLKEDLDQQVDIKQRMRIDVKDRERELDACNNEASAREIAVLRREAAAKRVTERVALTQAWDRDKKLHQVKKAVENHHKTPGPIADLPERVRSFGASAAGSGSGVGQMTPRSGTGSSRPITGSVRRLPIGAAASLALQREKLVRR